MGDALANSARIGPDTGGGWVPVLQNLENALPAQQYTHSTIHRPPSTVHHPPCMQRTREIHVS
eukprot:COSAG05_NODE_2079_length_3603_cov_2.777968_4_plen_63_part_00